MDKAWSVRSLTMGSDVDGDGDDGPSSDASWGLRSMMVSMSP